MKKNIVLFVFISFQHCLTVIKDMSLFGFVMYNELSQPFNNNPQQEPVEELLNQLTHHIFIAKISDMNGNNKQYKTFDTYQDVKDIKKTFMYDKENKLISWYYVEKHTRKLSNSAEF